MAKSKNTESWKNFLFSAINNADFPFIKKCLEQGANVNDIWMSEDETIFTKAIEKGNPKVIEFLIQNGADVNKRGKHTPLITAVRNNHLQVVELLVKHRADVNEADFLGRRPLNEALGLNRIDVAKFLMYHGANIKQQDGKGRLPLVLAVRSNNVEVVELLLRFGANKYKVDGEGNTAMVVAQRLNNSQIIQILEGSLPPQNKFDLGKNSLEDSYCLDSLEFIFAEEATEALAEVVLTSGNDLCPEETEKNAFCPKSNNRAKYEEAEAEEKEEKAEITSIVGKDANINDVDDDGFTPLTKAIHLEEEDTVKYLLSQRANTCRAANGKTPLIFAIQKNNLGIVKLLLQHGAGHTIQTALMEAIKLENLEIVRFFLEYGVVLDLRYKSGDTPLTSSIKTRNFQIVEALVENGADVNLSDKDGNLPLVLSIGAGNKDITRYLIRKGANLSKKMKDEVLKKYLKEDNLEMVDILVETLELDTDYRFDCGYTLLTKAASLGSLNVVKFLLNSKDGVNSVDGNGRTALGIAATNQDFPLVKYLIEVRADLKLAEKEVEDLKKRSEDFCLYMEFKI